MNITVKKILTSGWILLKLGLSMFEGILCSLVANRIYDVEKKEWHFKSNIALFLVCLVLFIFLAIVALHDVKKNNRSLSERKADIKLDALVKHGAFDIYAIETVNAMRNGDMNKFKNLQEMGNQL